jgi:hypothetical protein
MVQITISENYAKCYPCHLINQSAAEAQDGGSSCTVGGSGRQGESRTKRTLIVVLGDSDLDHDV